MDVRFREVDPFSRDVRRLERATTRLVDADGRMPTDEDLAGELDVTPERVRRLKESRRAMSRQSLDEVITSERWSPRRDEHLEELIIWNG